MARALFEPSLDQRQTVRVMVACGIPQPSICAAIVNPESGAPIDPKTLRRAFRAEIKDAKATANGLVAQSLFSKATGNGTQSVTAAIFWLKTQAGWREAEGPDVSDDPPPAAKVVVQVVSARKRPDDADPE